MAQSILFHEKEEAEMAQKLAMLKNQIMENDTGFGLSKRFGAVRKGALGIIPNPAANTACVISFLSEGGEYYVVVDTKNEKTEINMKNIEQCIEKDNGDIKLIYFMPV